MDSVGGYRLVRRLGGGSSADVWLTVAEPPRAEMDPADATTGGFALVTKVFLPEVGRDRVDGELRMLASVDHPRLVSLVDVVTGAGTHPALVLQRHDPAGLRRLLSTRGLDPGECITILAPVIDLVRAIHEEGLTHGRLSTAAVLLADDGGPVVLGGPGAERGTAHRDACVADHRMLVELSDQVFEAADHVPGRVSEIRSWLRSGQCGDRFFLDRFEELLFSIGEPRPVLDRPPNVDESALPATPQSFHSIGGIDSAVRMPFPSHEGDDSRVIRRRERRPQRRPLPRLIVSIVDRLRNGTASLRRAWDELRRGFRILAVVGLVCITALGFALLAPGSSSTEAAATLDGGSDSVPSADPSTTPESADVENGDSSFIPDEHGADDQEQETAEDPVAAAVTLLRARDACMEERSAECLKDVVQPGSPASVTEPERIVASGGAAVQPLLPEGVEPELVSALGGVVILSVSGRHGATQPASVLMIWTEAGWRLRDVFSE